MMRFIPGPLILTILSSLLVLPAISHAAWEEPELGYRLNKVKIPQQAPDFKLLDMDEESHQLQQYRGKVILLNFWDTWCPPCRREMPSMERLHQSMGESDFKVIAINQMEDMDHVFAYTGQLEVDPTFTILFDSDSSVSRRYAAKGLPTTYLIDKRGVIRYRAIGGREFDHPKVIELIKGLLAE